MTRVVMHPSFSATYASFFVEGLDRLYGHRSISYSDAGFPVCDPASGLVLLRTDDSNARNICIAPDDKADIDEQALAWCDVYAKVNLDLDLVPPGNEGSFVATGPAFGIRAWGLFSGAADAARTRRFAPFARARIGGRGYWAQLRNRLPEASYQARPSDDRYVFFLAWPWKHHSGVNPPRAAFVRVCKQLPGVEFEGGFAPRRRNDMPELDGLFADRRVPLREFVAKTSRSAFVFNTPAVHECLGWKLGEFLALGKAVITLPISRELPAPLEHGEHVHVVDGSESSINEAAELLLHDLDYRRHLERGAREYYDRWVRPDVMMRRILEHEGRPADV
jgi:hypothetical protein